MRRALAGLSGTVVDVRCGEGKSTELIVSACEKLRKAKEELEREASSV